jgi:hypothetical protein
LQQEEVHLSSLANLLNSYNTTPIPPCNYSFPVDSTKRFLELADVITSVGIGAIIGLTERLAVMDPVLVRTVSSTLTVESRHDAFFRSIRGEVPNPAPFDTGISDIWAYNLALSFIVPGSCPAELPLPILPRLAVTQPAVAPFANATAPLANTTAPFANTTAPYANATYHMRTPLHQREHHCPYANTTAPHANSTTAPYANATTPYANATTPHANATAPVTNVTAPYANATAPTERPAKLEFTWDPMQAPFVAESGEQLLVGWVNQLNVPVYTPLDISVTGKGTACIPQGMNGIAFAVITVQQPDNVNDLALATMAGPVVVSLSEGNEVKGTR